jgi:hypothetical protein
VSSFCAGIENGAVGSIASVASVAAASRDAGVVDAAGIRVAVGVVELGGYIAWIDN